MITESKYHSKLYGKTTRSFEFETLLDLRTLKEQLEAVTIYYINDSCVSFKTLNRIKKELKDKTVSSAGKTFSLYEWLKRQNNIVKLTNPYRFTCEALRGYPNTYKVEWQTRKEIVTAETKTNLWQEVTQTIETGKNEYAEHTVKPVKLVPHRVQIIKTNYDFEVIRWYGGNVTTYNKNPNPEFVKAFDLCLFHGRK